MNTRLLSSKKNGFTMTGQSEHHPNKPDLVRYEMSRPLASPGYENL